MEFQVTYYRTLKYTGKITADTLAQAKEKAEEELSGMSNAQFQERLDDEVEVSSEQESRQPWSTTLTEEDAGKLQEAFRGHRLEALIRLALATGMRRDELLRLKWQDVDLEGRVLHFQDTKTRAVHTLPIPDTLAEMLKEHRLRQNETQADPDPGLVFTSPSGSALDSRQLIEAVRKVLDQAGLLPIRFHDLRAIAKKRALDDLLMRKRGRSRPVVVCLCGSTRFSEAWQDANLRETLAGRIVLSIGCNTKSDEDLTRAGVEIDKEMLDQLHLAKIDMADEVLILNVKGYVGESTRREIEYARRLGKRIRWLEPMQVEEGK